MTSESEKSGEKTSNKCYQPLNSVLSFLLRIPSSPSSSPLSCCGPSLLCCQPLSITLPSSKPTGPGMDTPLPLPLPDLPAPPFFLSPLPDSLFITSVYATSVFAVAVLTDLSALHFFSPYNFSITLLLLPSTYTMLTVL